MLVHRTCVCICENALRHSERLDPLYHPHSGGGRAATDCVELPTNIQNSHDFPKTKPTQPGSRERSRACAYSFGRHADNRRSLVHICQHQRARAHLRKLPNTNIPQYGGAGAKHHAFAYRWVSLPVKTPRASQRYPMQHRHVIRNLRRLPNHHARRVINKRAGPDLCRGVDFHVQLARGLRLNVQRELSSVLMRPQIMRHAIRAQRMEPFEVQQRVRKSQTRRVSLHHRQQI
mmetsp:Transcript_4818/g.10290  ORF Transcript_4818/g.10290 Transcript_4818/m.10290 type:complete len:232 (+) Transcript_4818:357-1052(+)